MTIKTTWWNTSARDLVYLRWSFLVIINTLFPLFLASGIIENASQLIGIFLAIASFVVIYAELDLWLISQQRLALSKQLRISAVIKFGSPLLPFIDMLCGMLSIAISKFLTGFDLERINRHAQHHMNGSVEAIERSALLDGALTYLTTMVNGVLLTLLVGAILLLVRIFGSKLAKRRAKLNC